MRGVGLAALIAVMVTANAAAHAQAKMQPQPPAMQQAGPPKPWARGVSPAEQAKATALYSQGNALFVDSHYAKAIAKYRAALAHWDHPRIRYNLAVTLINFEKPLAAYAQMKRALRYGAAPFSREKYQQAQTYLRLLAGRLAVVTITCSEPGARVLLDGQRLFTAPGAITRVMLPGAHQLVARKSGFLTTSEPLMLIPGKKSLEKVKLVTLASATVLKRPMKAWIPWVTMGSGALVGLIGAGLQAQATSDYNQYDAIIAQQCPNGCSPVDVNTFDGIKDRAHTENIAAIAAFAAGGTAVVTGVALLFLNSPRPIVPAERRPVSRGPAVIPTAGPGGAGVTLRLPF